MDYDACDLSIPPLVSWRRDWMLAGMCGGLYAVAAWLARSSTIQPEGLAVIWAGAGVLLGFLLVASRRAWIPILLVVYVVVAFLNLIWGNSVEVSLGSALANCLGPGVTAVAGLSVVGRVPRIDDRRDVSLLAGVVGITTAVTALLGAAVIHKGTGGAFWMIWEIWWLEDAMGILVLTPLVLEAHRLSTLGLFRWPRLERGALLSGFGVIVVSVWVFLLPPSMAPTHLARPFLLVPFVGYFALRFGSTGAVLSNAWLAVIVSTGLALHVGAFESYSFSNRAQALGAQLFLAVGGVTSLVAGAFAAEQRQLNADLQRTLDHVKTLTGLLPICSGCKKIRDDTGAWHALETYVMARTEAKFTHGMCPACIRMHYPEYTDDAT